MFDPADATLSVVIPARDEVDVIEETVRAVSEALSRANITHEILVIDDGSADETSTVVSSLVASVPGLKLFSNPGPNGFGCAVRLGLERASGDAIAVFMADGSDSPDDVVRCVRKLGEGYECVFGSRFLSDSHVIDYPKHKLLLNRLANTFIRVLFGLRFNDITNAFKVYRRHVIDGIQPLISHQFNLTVEMPLKSIVRRYSYAVVPISWTNRKAGISKLKIKEIGSRYLFIVLYVWLEKFLARGDYSQPDRFSESRRRPERVGTLPRWRGNRS